MKTIGLEPWSSTPEELAPLQTAEIAKWAKVVKASGQRQSEQRKETAYELHP
jgi:tripartite-type tricarboxylate transporter receptor subunit TctC